MGPSIRHVRRDVVVELGGYDETLAPSEDKDLFRRLALSRYEARSVEEPLVRYRTHPAQLSQQQRSVQLANDHVGQERFLAELVSETSPRQLRLFLAGDPGYWSDALPDPGATLDRVLVGCANRLEMDTITVSQLEGLLTRHLAARSLEGWRETPLRWLRTGPTVALLTLQRLPRRRRMPYATAYLLVFALAPLLFGAQRMLKTVARLANAAPPLRRSRLVRRIYGKLVGSS